MISDSKINVQRYYSDKKELTDLKFQVALHLERLDLATRELNEALVEVKALNAEKATLLDELTTAKQVGGRQKITKHSNNIGVLCRSF